MQWTDSDLKALQEAKVILENPGVVARLTNLLGRPIEEGFELLPASWNEKVMQVTQASLEKALDFAVTTMGKDKTDASNILHKVAVTATGGIGGALGFTALPVELPISTTIMLRSIADIARSEGHSLYDLDTRLECLKVFALGGESKDDDGVESSYFAIRTILAQSMAEATSFIAEKGLMEEGAPVLVRAIVQIAERFSIQVSEKVAAQAIPIIGAVSGAAINVAFIDHFQDMARGHFIVRRLEKTYGEIEVKEQYLRLPYR